MLCSVCHKNVAVIFTKRIDGEKTTTEGFCYECAKKKGINPLEVLAEQSGMTDEQLENISKQFESILGELTEDINPEDLENMEEQGNLGSIFSNMFSGKKEESQDSKKQSGNTKVKTKQKEKKKSFLEIYGTN